MQSKKEVENEIKVLKALEDLVKTYQEIAATRMRKVKNSVLKNREFLEAIAEVYKQVKYSYNTLMHKILQKKLKRSEKKPLVSILLLSNTMLYGDILRKTFEVFLRDITNTKTDVILVGKIALLFYKESGMQKEYTYFDLSDGQDDHLNLEKIALHLVNYEKVAVYHGKYKDILSQVGVNTFVSGDLPDNDKSQDVNVSYLYEPSLEEVLDFFEKQIIRSLFEQTVNESNLSKYTSRMISLESAIDSIESDMQKSDMLRNKLKHSILNKSQLSSISGISLWEGAK